jgi:hypothetical protein
MDAVCLNNKALLRCSRSEPRRTTAEALAQLTRRTAR